MDEDFNIEDFITRYLEGRLNIHLSEQQIHSYSDSENVSMSVQHNLPMNDGFNVSSEGNSSHILEDSEQLLHYLDPCPRTENISIAVHHALPSEAFIPLSQYNRVPQETLSRVPNFSTPVFAWLPEIWNTEQLGMDQRSSNFVTIQPQGGDVLRQNLLSSQYPTSYMYFAHELPAYERYPAVPSTSESFHFDPHASVVNEPFRVPNLNHYDKIKESSSEPGDNCPVYIVIDHLDFMNCHLREVTNDSVEECHLNETSAFNHEFSEESILIGRHNSTGLSFNSPGRFDTPSGNASCFNHNPTSQKNLDITGMCYSSKKGRGSEKSKHGPNAISSVCGNVFATKGEVIRNKKVKHGSKESLHCDYCSKRFLNFSMLKRHLRMHTGEKPFMCEVCNKSFAQSSALRVHERVHTGEKPYICQMCNKGFSQNTSLSKHESVHTEEKPYMCKLCNKGFRDKSDLIRHERTHTGEKPFVCNVCYRGFSQISNLRQHERTHKPSKCE